MILLPYLVYVNTKKKNKQTKQNKTKKKNNVENGVDALVFVFDALYC